MPALMCWIIYSISPCLAERWIEALGGSRNAISATILGGDFMNFASSSLINSFLFGGKIKNDINNIICYMKNLKGKYIILVNHLL